MGSCEGGARLNKNSKHINYSSRDMMCCNVAFHLMCNYNRDYHHYCDSPHKGPLMRSFGPFIAVSLNTLWRLGTHVTIVWWKRPISNYHKRLWEYFLKHTHIRVTIPVTSPIQSWVLFSNNTNRRPITTVFNSLGSKNNMATETSAWSTTSGYSTQISNLEWWNYKQFMQIVGLSFIVYKVR